jgi:hypothetical protein
MLRAHVDAIVTATTELEEARQQVAKSGTALSDLLERMDSPLWGQTELSIDAQIDLARRARGIASDVDSNESVEVDRVPQLVEDAAELQKLVEFFLTRATQEAVA